MTDNNIRLIVIMAIGLLVSACGSPQSEFNKVIEEEGYIAYNTPLASAGVGTILRGSPDALRVATHPERCFPNQVDHELRWVTETSLPSQYSSFQLDFGIDLADILMAGNPLVNLNLGFNHAKQVQVQFKGATVEYLDEFSFYYYYNLDMNGFCKQMLSESPFIVQALRIEEMSFKFYSNNGVGVKLSPGMIGDIMNIGVGTSWRIEKNYSLIIDSPKYIGYQAGFMDGENPGRISHLATSASGGDWNFDRIDEVPVPVSNIVTADLSADELD